MRKPPRIRPDYNYYRNRQVPLTVRMTKIDENLRMCDFVRSNPPMIMLAPCEAYVELQKMYIHLRKELLIGEYLSVVLKRNNKSLREIEKTLDVPTLILAIKMCEEYVKKLDEEIKMLKRVKQDEDDPVIDVDATVDNIRKDKPVVYKRIRELSKMLKDKFGKEYNSEEYASETVDSLARKLSGGVDATTTVVNDNESFLNSISEEM